jgi:hypothetical protein
VSKIPNRAPPKLCPDPTPQNPDFSPEEAVFIVGWATYSLYHFQSGQPQIAHLLLGAFSLFALRKQRIPSTPLLRSLVLLTTWIVGVEVVGRLLSEEPDRWSGVQSFYWIFNTVVTAGLYSHFKNHDPRSFLWGTALGVAVVMTGFVLKSTHLVGSGVAFRTTSYFNNPNQLGYYALILASAIFLLQRDSRLSQSNPGYLHVCVAALALVSLSKAAILGLLLFYSGLAFALLTSEKFAMKSLIHIATGVIVFLTLVLAASLSEPPIDVLDRFLHATHEVDSSFEARGYFRFRDASYREILFGFASQPGAAGFGAETHSSLLGVMHRYGLVGAALLMLVLINWAVTLYRGYSYLGLICVIGPTMLYGLAHNGLRFTAFFVLLGVSTACAQRKVAEKLSAGRSLSKDT